MAESEPSNEGDGDKEPEQISVSNDLEKGKRKLDDLKTPDSDPEIICQSCGSKVRMSKLEGFGGRPRKHPSTQKKLGIPEHKGVVTRERESPPKFSEDGNMYIIGDDDQQDIEKKVEGQSSDELIEHMGHLDKWDQEASWQEDTDNEPRLTNNRVDNSTLYHEVASDSTIEANEPQGTEPEDGNAGEGQADDQEGDNESFADEVPQSGGPSDIAEIGEGDDDNEYQHAANTNDGDPSDDDLGDGNYNDGDPYDADSDDDEDSESDDKSSSNGGKDGDQESRGQDEGVTHYHEADGCPIGLANLTLFDLNQHVFGFQQASGERSGVDDGEVGGDEDQHANSFDDEEGGGTISAMVRGTSAQAAQTHGLHRGISQEAAAFTNKGMISDDHSDRKSAKSHVVSSTSPLVDDVKEQGRSASSLVADAGSEDEVEDNHRIRLQYNDTTMNNFPDAVDHKYHLQLEDDQDTKITSVTDNQQPDDKSVDENNEARTVVKSLTAYTFEDPPANIAHSEGEDRKSASHSELGSENDEKTLARSEQRFTGIQVPPAVQSEFKDEPESHESIAMPIDYGDGDEDIPDWPDPDPDFVPAIPAIPSMDDEPQSADQIDTEEMPIDEEYLATLRINLGTRMSGEQLRALAIWGLQNGLDVEDVLQSTATQDNQEAAMNWISSGEQAHQRIKSEDDLNGGADGVKSGPSAQRGLNDSTVVNDIESNQARSSRLPSSAALWLDTYNSRLSTAIDPSSQIVFPETRNLVPDEIMLAIVSVYLVRSRPSNLMLVNPFMSESSAQDDFDNGGVTNRNTIQHNRQLLIPVFLNFDTQIHTQNPEAVFATATWNEHGRISVEIWYSFLPYGMSVTRNQVLDQIAQAISRCSLWSGDLNEIAIRAALNPHWHGMVRHQDWNSGLHVVLAAWAHILDLDMEKNPLYVNERIFTTRAHELLGLASHGKVDFITIEAFLRAYGFVRDSLDINCFDDPTKEANTAATYQTSWQDLLVSDEEAIQQDVDANPGQTKLSHDDHDNTESQQLVPADDARRDEPSDVGSLQKATSANQQPNSTYDGNTQNGSMIEAKDKDLTMVLPGGNGVPLLDEASQGMPSAKSQSQDNISQQEIPVEQRELPSSMRRLFVTPSTELGQPLGSSRISTVINSAAEPTELLSEPANARDPANTALELAEASTNDTSTSGSYHTAPGVPQDDATHSDKTRILQTKNLTEVEGDKKSWRGTFPRRKKR